MHERNVKKLKSGHYVATHGRLTPDPPYVHSNRAYSTDGEDSHQGQSERTISEYTIAHERVIPLNSGQQHYANTTRKSRSKAAGRNFSSHNGSNSNNNVNHQPGSYKHIGNSNNSNISANITSSNNNRTPHNSRLAMSSSSSPAAALTVDGIGGGGPRTLIHASPRSRIPPRAPSALSYDHGGDTGSDIYVTSGAYKAPSEISRYSHRPISRGAPHSVYSIASTAKTGRSARSHKSKKRGAKIEAMSAPNPFCPNVKGVCCLMLLLNLGLILVTLGFVIVMQFYDPLYVWILGIIFLIFGFLTLIGCMVYCVYVCRDAKTPSQVRNEDLYWTRHWQKNIGYTPQEINYKSDKYDAYSDRYSVSKISGKYSDRGSNRY